MAGGIGSRFWPMSTPEYPKQFVDVLGRGMSMIQMTVERFAPLCPIENMWVVTSSVYEPLVREQLPQLPAENILLEPAMRNTAPCIAYACWKIRQKNPHANVVVTPADALVVDVEDFRKVMTKALEFTSEGRRIVTVGIRPTRPETGYGYIEIAGQAGNDARMTGNDEAVVPGVIGQPLKVHSFREKPALPVAKEYLAAGNYLWNAGIFVWNVDTIVDSLRSFVPDLAEKMDVMAESFYTDAERDKVGEIFPTCEKISIDYAVMEKADCIYTIPADFGWSDLGTWNSLRQHSNPDKYGNAIIGQNVDIHESHNSIIHTTGLKKVVIQGIEDCIIAEKDGTLLICKISDEERIRLFH